MTSTPVLVIAGSVRGPRRSPAIARWIAQLGAARSDSRFEVVDLAALGLGLDDEPGLPAKGGYLQESTRRWSARVAACPGVVFVTPQYNWGYPAALKNAIDHLHAEWRGKPGLLVSYGGHGGGKAAAQLREVLTGLHMRLAEAAPGLVLARARIEADDGTVDPPREFAEQQPAVEAALDAFLTLLAAPE